MVCNLIYNNMVRNLICIFVLVASVAVVVVVAVSVDVVAVVGFAKL